MPNTKSQIPNPKAFTLIELLVVIAVIALLMAILLPALGRVRSQARALRCRANLKQWSMILVMYTDDSEGCLPRHTGDAVWLLRGSLPSEADVNAPGEYTSIRTQGIACCPLATEPGETGQFILAGSSNSAAWQVEGTLGSTFNAWQIINPGPLFPASYGFNSELFSLRFLRALARHPRRFIGVDIHVVPNRDVVPVLLDSGWPGSTPHTEFRGPPRIEKMGASMGCINRHEGCINGLFMDGSVRRIGLKELWTLKWNPEFDTRGPWTRAGGVLPEDWPKWMRTFKDY